MQEGQKNTRLGVRLLKWSLRIVGVFLLLLFILYLIFQIPSVQAYAAKRTAIWLSKKSGTEVSIENAKIRLFNFVELESLLIQDYNNQDTILAAARFDIQIRSINPFGGPRIAVKEINLVDASLHMRRDEDDADFSFVRFIDAIAGASGDDAPVDDEPSKSSGSKLRLKLGGVRLNNVQYIHEDEQSPTDFKIKVPNGRIRLQQLDLKQKRLDIRYVEMENVLADFWKYQLVERDTLPPDSIHLTTGGWEFNAGKIELTNTQFRYNDTFKPYEDSGDLDFAHLDIQDININIRGARFVTDTITGTFEKVAFHDHSGFDLNELRGNFYVSNEEIVVDRMLLETSNSRITDHFAMWYGDFNAFSNFLENVRMDINMEGTELSLKDLAYFAPETFQSDETISIDGRVYGSIDNLKGRDLLMSFGRYSAFEGRLDINGLPNISESFIQFRMKRLRTSANDLYAVIPDLKLPIEIEKLGRFSAQGEFTGFPRDFVAYGSLESGIGSLNSDLNMKFDEAGLPSYSGNIDLDNFDLGLWTGQEKLGTVSLASDIKGSGLTLNNLDVELNADIANVSFNDYTYQNLSFNGTVRKNFFEGALLSADPGFDQNFQGTIDFSVPKPVFEFTSTINAIDLQAMNFSKTPLTIKGTMDLNLEGNHVDSILGKASLNDIALVDGADRYLLDSLVLTAAERDGQRSLTLNTDLFSAAFNGDFQLTKMPDAIKALVAHYFPGSGIQPDSVVVDQDLLFAVNIKDSRNFTQLISPEIGQILNSNITGSFNSARKQFDARAKFPEITLGGQQIETLLIDIRTDNDELEIFTRANKIYLTDSFYTPATVFQGNYARDSLFFNLYVGKDTDADRMHLKGAVTAIDESFRFNVLPSEIYTRNKRWEISPNNSLVYDYRSLKAEDFVLKSGDQVISLTSLDREGFNSFLELDLTSIEMEEVFHAIRRDELGMKGTLDGKISIANLFDKPGFLGNLAVKDFHLSNVLMGDVQLNTSLQSPQNRLNFIATLEGTNDVVANGGYYLNKDDNRIDAEINVRSLDISPFEVFLAGLVSGLKGDVTGRLTLKGDGTNPDLNGSMQLADGGFKLDYLGVPYKVPLLEMEASGSRLTFKPATIYDSEGNTGFLTSGGIYHVGFDQWWLDNITITTPNMLFMDNNRETSPQLFGTAYGTGAVQLDGAINDLNITVNAQSNKGTAISIPIYGSKSVAGNDFINFINTEETSADSKDDFYSSKVNFSFYLDITEDALVELDIGDKLTGSGTGNLHIEINTLGDIRMTGLYTVAQGKYAFSLQDLISKEFEIEKGGTISWTGDPYTALLNLRAIYNTRASTYDLLDETYTATIVDEAEQRRAQRRQDVKVYLELTGALESPNIDFDIEVPQGQNSGVSIVERKLQEIESDKNELNRQVFGLLVFNRFIPDQSGFTPLFSGASTSVSEFLSKQLSGYFSDWLSQYVTDLDVNIGYRTYADNLSELGSEEELEVELSKKFFNDRIYINLGGNFDLSNNDPGNTTADGNVAGDFEIEYAITPDGRFRIRAFQRTDYDLIVEENYIETGVGIFYSQEFNSLYELVSNRRKRRNLKKDQGG